MAEISAPPRPNILLLMTDQQRGDCLGCDGHPVLETPYLDQLAAEGTRFRRAYSAVPSCAPARSTLLTGMDAWHTGVMGLPWELSRSDYAHTLPGELAKGGYHTQGIGKMDFTPARALMGFHHTIIDEHRMDPHGAVPNFHPYQISDYQRWFEEHKTESCGIHDHGLDWNSWMAQPSHLPEHLHPTHWTAQQAIEFLDRRDPTKPFFLKVSFIRPHSPYDPPQRYYDLYKGRPIPDPYVGAWASIHDDPAAAVKIDAWRGRRSAEQIRRARACYYGNITFIDHQIGRLVWQTLMRHHRQAWDNTLVVFLSDHGDMLGDHHLWRKVYAYEGSARIPMFIRPPNNWQVPRGQVLDNVVELRDVMPTLLDAAGLAVPSTCQGHSMLPLVRGQKGASWRPYLHGEHVKFFGPEQANHYLTDGREKYIWFPYLDREQLFDLTVDPGECQDLAGQPSKATQLKLWRDRLAEILAQRDCGLTRDGKLLRQPPERIILPPCRSMT